MIEIKDLSYTIGKKEILKNISFTVNKGSMTCIVGPNGCGKSTLLAHISRRLPSRNSIYYKGCAVETIPRKEYAKEVAVMVQQGFGMAGDLKAEDVVLMGRYPFKGRFSDYTKEDHQIAERVMIETGASILSGREMQHMSGGEKQRISIARAILKDAPIIILDEATSSVDPENEQALLSAIQELTKDKTLISIAHRLSTIQNADQIVVLEKGHIVDQGTQAELLRRCLLYQKLWQAHIGAQGWAVTSGAKEGQ